jgi:aminopeptidase C
MITTNERSKSTYKAMFVDKTKQVNGKPVTKFKIRDRVRGTANEFIDYYVTVFDRIDLESGDYIKFLDFDNLVASYYEKTNKINFFMSAIVRVVNKPTGSREIDNPYEE